MATKTQSTGANKATAPKAKRATTDLREALVDKALKKRCQDALSRYRAATKGETARWDERFEVLAEIINSDPPCYLAEGYATTREILKAEAPNETERDVSMGIRVAVHFATAMIGVTACGSCSGPGSPSAQPSPADGGLTESGRDAQQSEAAPHDAGTEESGVDGGSADADRDGCAPDDLPGVPAGWERWEGWSCGCPLFYPGKNGKMPDPIAWEPCQEPFPQNVACKQMRHSWNETLGAVAPFPRMSVDPGSGLALLAFTRINLGGLSGYQLVAQADGPVQTAFFGVRAGGARGCSSMEESLTGDYYGYSILGDTWDGPLHDPKVPVVEGLLAGRAGDPLPTAVIKLPADPNLGSAWSVSSQWIVQLKGVRPAWSWDTMTQRTVYDPSQDPDHLVGGYVTMIGKEVFVGVGDAVPAGVMVWNAVDGLRPLIRWYGDPSRAAGNFGTDAKDMVWTYLEGSSMSVMTAPYSTDAAQVEATTRRVCADVGTLSPNAWAVGCGHAARALGGKLFVVRLSDGTSWILPGQVGLPRLAWGLAMGFTCDELFAVAETQTTTVNTARIARIRLDSLGPGTPPD